MFEELKARYERLGTDASEEQIRLTKEALGRRQYMPVLLLPIRDFFLFTKADMLAEFERVVTLPPDSEELKAVVGLGSGDEVKEKHLLTLLNQYEILRGLRTGDGDAWALVNELYEDD